MKPKGPHALTAALIGLGWAAVSGIAYAESNTVMSHAEMRKICTEEGGRFEQSWQYNDQGMQWGRVLSCATDEGAVTCQDRICRSTQWARPDEATAADSGTDGNHGTAPFPTDPAAFARALAALAEK